MTDLEMLKKRAESAQKEYQYALLRDAAEKVVSCTSFDPQKSEEKVEQLREILDRWNPDAGGQI